jgi:PAS domain S-box-containing protein
MKNKTDSAGKLIELRQKIVSLEKELQEKEIKLQKTEEKFKSFFDSITDMLLIIDGRNRLIVHANQQACYMLGYKNLLYRDYTGLFPGKDEILSSPEDITFYDNVCEYKEITLSDGSLCPVDITVSVIDWYDKKAILLSLRDRREKKIQEEEREKLVSDLQEAFSKIKTLKGLIPICSSCKKMRDDKGYWNSVEEYIKTYSEAEFSEAVCPSCMTKFYPSLINKI